MSKEDFQRPAWGEEEAVDGVGRDGGDGAAERAISRSEAEEAAGLVGEEEVLGAGHSHRRPRPEHFPLAPPRLQADLISSKASIASTETLENSAMTAPDCALRVRIF